MPRLLGFYRDIWDDDGTAVGWHPIAWGLRFADGSALSISIEGPASVTLWQSVEDATEALDAYVDTAEPRIHLDHPGDVPRLLGLYRDIWDDDGTAVGWQPIAWGLRFADGSALSISIEGPASVTLWQSVEDATEALDAYVDTAEPRIHLDHPGDVPRIARGVGESISTSLPDDATRLRRAELLAEIEETDQPERAMRARRPSPAVDVPHWGPRLTDTDPGDTLVIEAPPDEAFTRLLEAAHVVGAVSYVDRANAIFEVVVMHDGGACSLVVTLQGRATGTEVFCTLESLERVASPSPEPVVRQLADALRGTGATTRNASTRSAMKPTTN